jgi:hypothetical protein
MLLFAFTSLVGLAACLPSSSPASSKKSNSQLVVAKVPDHVRPYIVRAYTLDGYRVGSQIYRFPVTGPSSDYAFTLISTSAPASSELGVLPHVGTSAERKLVRQSTDLDTSLMQRTTKTSTAYGVAMLSGPAKTMSPPAVSLPQGTMAPFPTTPRTASSSLTPLSKWSA